ncbi:MAG: N-6 DNA methylase [Candidatus Cryptobacteroides sp.]|nr:N-6 DNA methylase [Candidatus Cryptobacteroides sp.]
MKKQQAFKFDNFKFTSQEIDRLIVTSFVHNTNINVNGYLQKLVIDNDDQLSSSAKELHCKGIEDAIHYFEIAVPKGESTTNGAVYTPKIIRDRIVDKCFADWSANNVSNPADIKCADISCGCGAFLFTVIEKIQTLTNSSFKQACKQVYGVDINPDSVERTKILLSMAAAERGEYLDEDDFNIFCMNSLTIDESFPKMDIVIGNPPYVRAKNIGDESKALLRRWSVARNGNPDLYIPFFEICLSCLKESGSMGLITPNTFLTSVNGRALRYFLSENHYSVTIENFRQEKVFEGKMVYTCITYVDKLHIEGVKYVQVSLGNLTKTTEEDYSQMTYSSLDHKKGWFLSQGEIFHNIQKIESTGTSLGSLYSIKNGIATLANDVFIFKPTKEDEQYYYVGSSKIEKSICRNIIKPNKLKTEEDIPILLEKAIFPYTKDMSLFEEEYFKATFPETVKYLEQHMETLLSRDKGECDYPWYAYGRTQAIEDKGIKLLFPYMAGEPHFVYTEDSDMMIYCGYAIYSDSSYDLLVLKKILESKVFDYYIRNTSKPYSGGFYAYAKNYVKNFGVCELSVNEKDYLYHEHNRKSIDDFLCEKYGITI